MGSPREPLEIADRGGFSRFSPCLWHSVLKGANNSEEAQTQYQGPTFASGQTYYAFAVFAAPPNDVQKVQVSVVDGMSLVQGVEIQ